MVSPRGRAHGDEAEVAHPHDLEVVLDEAADLFGKKSWRKLKAAQSLTALHQAERYLKKLLISSLTFFLTPLPAVVTPLFP